MLFFPASLDDAWTTSACFLPQVEKYSCLLCVLHQGLPGPAGLKGEAGDPGPQVGKTCIKISIKSISGDEKLH